MERERKCIVKPKLNKLLIASLVLISLILTACTTIRTSQANIEYLYEANKYEEIIASADEEALIKSQDYESLYLLASSYHLTGAHEDANELISKVIELKDEMKYRILKHNILESLDLHEEQEVLIASTLADYEDRYESLGFDDKSNYCYWLILNNENDEAIAKYENLLEDLPLNFMKDAVYNNLAWACLNTYDYEKAKEYSLKSLELQPDDSITLTNLGNSYYGLEEYSEAKVTYEKALKSNPNNSYAVYGLANTLDVLDDSNAIKYWKYYVELQPYDFDGWYNIYAYYSESNETEKEINALEKIVQLQPSYTYYIKELLALYYEMGEYGKINEALNSFKGSNNHFQYDLLVADYTYETVSVDDGYDLYVQILDEYEVEYWDLYAIIESLYYNDEKKHFDNFINEIEKRQGISIRLDLESEFYYEYGEYGKLIDVAERMIEEDDTNSYAFELLADGFYFNGEYENAYLNYTNALNYGESSFYLNLSLADCAIYMRNLIEADSILKELQNENSDSAIVYVHKARIHMLEGNHESAIEMIKKTLSISPYMDYVLDEYTELEPIKETNEIKVLIGNN